MEEETDERNLDESLALVDSNMSDGNRDDDIEMEQIPSTPEVVTRSQNVDRQKSSSATLGKTCQIAMLIDYFTFHILCHLILVSLDIYIAYCLITSSLNLPMDWVICTISFVVIPHILRSLFKLITQDWPSFNLKVAKQICKCSVMKKIVWMPIWNFEWRAIFEALPVIHLVKRFANFYMIVRYPETRMKPVLQEREDENLYCVTFHSGAQITIQLAIGFQLDTFTWYQILSLCLHSIYILHSGSSFFFTQRSTVSMSPHGPIRERFLVFGILGCIFLPKLLSFGLLFSYARTFLTVAFIVVFGIGTMALFYDQYVPKQPSLPQMLHGFVSVWLPCVPGFKTNFLLKSSIASVALHLICHTVLLIQMFSLQETSVRYLPLRFHCFPAVQNEETQHLKGYFCPTENRTSISFGNCVEEPNQELEDVKIYARICPKGEFQHDQLLLYVLPTMVAMVVSLVFSFALAKISSKSPAKVSN